MAQKLFRKIFKTSKENDYRDRPLEIWPTAIGISDSSCEINGDPFNGWKLPIPAPEQRALSTCALHRASQNSSKFFQLPVEVRKMIYSELMGNRRVHIEYSWMFQSPFEPPTKRGGKRWNWFHGVCQNSNGFCEDAYLDRCDDRGDERWNARRMCRLTSAPPETKLHGVEFWLRCCQMGYDEALEVLYGTNVFVPRGGIGSLFIMSRMLSPICAQLIQSMDLTFEMYFWLCSTPEAEASKTVYSALFDLLEKQLLKLHSLRLTIQLPAWEKAKELMNEEKFNDLLAPWERLARGRYWKRLQFSVPFDWEPVLRPTQEAQSIWKLEVTAWYEKLTFLECK